MNARLWLVFVLALSLFALAMLTGCASPLAAPSASLPREIALVHAQRLAAEVGGKWWTVEGVSMAPFLTVNAVYVTESVDFAELRAGDVVVYRTKHLHTWVHRIVKPRGAGWIVAGDANGYSDDELLTRDNFLGRQCAVFFTQ